MTSGEFHSIPIEQITIAARQRRALGDVDNLADSIWRLGLIHPIVITRDHVLVAGERRLAACKKLGYDRINCQYVDEVDGRTLKAIELEENIKRLNIEWKDECKAVLEYHNLHLEDDPGWSQEDTAKKIGMKQASVSESLLVAQRLVDGDPYAQKAKFSTALTSIKNQISRDKDALQEARGGFKIIEKGQENYQVIHRDFTEWVKTYSGPRFNFIHCDFPYGINADKRQQGTSVEVHGGYDDTGETYWRLLTVLCSNLERICTESAHIMFWFSMHNYADTLAFFANHSNFIIDPFPLVWLKSDNIGLLPDPQRGPRRIYETALFGSRGDRKIVSSVSNAYAAETDRSKHMSAKPEQVLHHFFRMFIDQHSVVLDPTCGSGTALRAAVSLHAAHILGIELNKEFI
jgi:ParB/RepB/Spo0J family partition protein